MRVEMVENHTYIVNGDIAGISVTQLLKKHGLSPSYKGVDIVKLNESAKYGTEVHKDIEIFVANNLWIPETNEGYDYKIWHEANVQEAIAELPIGFEYNGMILAGTCDLLGTLKSGERFIADHKTTKTIYKESVRWQLSLLDYMYRKLGKSRLNGMDFEWKGADKFLVFHYPDGNLKEVVELEPIEDKEIEKLILAEYNNEIYEKSTLIIAEDIKNQIDAVEFVLSELKKEQALMESKAKELRALLTEEMRKQKVLTFETERVKVSYKGAYNKLQVDSEKLKKEYPFVYSNVVKMVEVKDSIVIKIKEPKGESNE